jgi:hypothetical protein
MCVNDEITEPPARCRLVSSHDLFEMVAPLILSLGLRDREHAEGRTGKGMVVVSDIDGGPFCKHALFD